MIAGAVLLAASGMRFRGWEVSATGWLMANLFPLTAVRAPGHPDVLHFQPASGPWYAIQITAACTAAVLVVPLLVVMGLLLCTRRFPASRILLAGGLAAVVVTVVNLGRVMGIAAALAYGDQSAFEVAHVICGTLATIVGGILAAVVFVRVLLGSRGRGRMAAAV